MANPQTENGYTQIANELLDHLIQIHLAPNQWQVLLCVIRKTYGYKKKVDYIANFQISEATGLHKSHVSRAICLLEMMNLITRKGKYIGIQKDWERWRKLSKLVTNGKLPELATLNTDLPKQATTKKLPILATELPISATKVTSPLVTQKKKENIQKKVVIPPWINQETWGAFLEVRKTIKAPVTAHAADLIFKKLARLKEQGHDPNEVLNQSIENSYRGVFPLKDNPVQTRGKTVAEALKEKGIE